MIFLRKKYIRYLKWLINEMALITGFKYLKRGALKKDIQHMR